MDQYFEDIERQYNLELQGSVLNLEGKNIVYTLKYHCLTAYIINVDYSLSSNDVQEYYNLFEQVSKSRSKKERETPGYIHSKGKISRHYYEYETNKQSYNNPSSSRTPIDREDPSRHSLNQAGPLYSKNCSSELHTECSKY